MSEAIEQLKLIAACEVTSPVLHEIDRDRAMRVIQLIEALEAKLQAAEKEKD